MARPHAETSVVVQLRGPREGAGEEVQAPNLLYFEDKEPEEVRANVRALQGNHHRELSRNTKGRAVRDQRGPRNSVLKGLHEGQRGQVH